MNEHGQADSLEAVPLFPLPNVVLFPRAILPLHIFEQRYRAMTADALAGSRQIAMALLRPGWEKCCYSRPLIDPVVCVGTILSHEKLPDGKYNFLLQGKARARVISETGGAAGDATPYRVARLEVISDRPVKESELAPQRAKLVKLFTDDVFATTGMARQVQKLLTGPLATPDIADVIAYSYFEDVELKQSLLAECCVGTRVRRTLAELEALRVRMLPGGDGISMN